jgi:hypothetical protein
MLTMIRRLLGIRLALTEEDALRIAKKHCLDREWEWLEPIRVSFGVSGYRIMTNANVIGGNISLWVNGMTGEVSSAGPAPR